MIKKMIATFKSRNSMKPIEYLFTDGLFNSKFYLYEDSDGFKVVLGPPFIDLTLTARTIRGATRNWTSLNNDQAEHAAAADGRKPVVYWAAR